jgi:hypothetical protein
MRYVIVCDLCHAELRELGVVDYHPRFEPRPRASAGHDARP